ncbi:MAG TPA: methyltransferase domain-containing protein [Acidimicrobiales bacterium]|nr:methyltransferase domain-containing protein [Acidimicrobiales bacterium]
MTNPAATPAATHEKYAASPAQNYERYFVPVIGAPFARRLLATARLAPGERVLDVACGTGVVTRLAAEAVGRDGAAAGVDVNPGMLEVARATSPPGAPIEWHQASAEALPLPDGSFDVVLCSLGFMFFPDKVGALREMRRVLAPGGRAVLGTPGPTPPLFEAIDEALTAHVGPGASMFVHAVFSVHDPAEVRDLLDAAGFDDVAIETGTVPLRVPAPADFFWEYVYSTPLAAIVGGLDAAARAALERDVVERCRPFVEGDATVMEPGLLVATARAR